MDGKTGQRTKNLEVNQFVCDDDDDDDDDDDKTILEKRCWKCVKDPTVHEASGIGSFSFELFELCSYHQTQIHGFVGRFVVSVFCSIIFWWKLKYVLLR